jgi:hypothetical protein
MALTPPCTKRNNIVQKKTHVGMNGEFCVAMVVMFTRTGNAIMLCFLPVPHSLET